MLLMHHASRETSCSCSPANSVQPTTATTNAYLTRPLLLELLLAIAAVLVPRASTAANPASSASTRQVGFSASNTCSMRNPGHGQDNSNQRQNQLVGPNAAMTSVVVLAVAASAIAGSLQAPLRSLHTLPAHVEDGMPILAKMQYAVTSPMGCQAVAPGWPWRRLSRLQHHIESQASAGCKRLLLLRARTSPSVASPASPRHPHIRPSVAAADYDSPVPASPLVLLQGGRRNVPGEDRRWFAVVCLLPSVCCLLSSVLLVGVKCCCVYKCQCICLLVL